MCVSPCLSDCVTVSGCLADSVRRVQYCTPGPGTYGKGGIPHSMLEEKALLSTSTKGMLDAYSGSRCQPSVVSEHVLCVLGSQVGGGGGLCMCLDSLLFYMFIIAHLELFLFVMGSVRLINIVTVAHAKSHPGLGGPLSNQ